MEYLCVFWTRDVCSCVAWYMGDMDMCDMYLYVSIVCLYMYMVCSTLTMCVICVYSHGYVQKPCCSVVEFYHNLAAYSKLSNMEDSLSPSKGFLFSTCPYLKNVLIQKLFLRLDA